MTTTDLLTAPPARRGRALHLVDLQNLVGSGSPTLQEAKATWAAYRALVQPGDLAVVACSHHAAPAVWFAVGTEARLLVRSGAGGADVALVDDVDLGHLVARFTWLVVASGDHAFVPLVETVRRAGVRTWQVTGAGRPAHALLRTAQVRSRLRATTAANLALAA
ncbi:conserved hypothetical protein [Cellulomonas flavigena DSM 20109]|uniref:NYN domain-containing protein n=1 Tax=Cellulomonas flavigena (strain ATCC 482 / DSM 20109 / BCRC 11376 / JCM 18109 / NBRC 3775 / NCIMB 8073 / NRS 134) TaxID=446466 RepID=D5UDD3_CELFN|nr:NYN domain-containing protein [Cellulomonas flavigena]ADG76389.1 conserved hypothetical protein [Cellulomonas flavigena DSM 20109]